MITEKTISSDGESENETAIASDAKPENEIANFANPEGINNIVTRVTGNNISEIRGTLGVEGSANLYFINPNGLFFNQNASLDLNGSFFATTAQAVIFNEFEYSAVNPNLPPIIDVGLMPLALLMVLAVL